jgi:hypothetical protein
MDRSSKLLRHPLAFVALVAAVALAACESPTERVPPDGESPPPIPVAAPRPQPWPAPAPQVMAAPPAAAAVPEQVLLQPMTEEERTEAFQALVGTTQTYTPPPQEVPVRYVEREGERYVSTEHVHSSSCGPGCSLGRVAVYTGLGAIIGHQFDDQGAGAAIGAGVALLTSPGWFGWSDWCDD